MTVQPLARAGISQAGRYNTARSSGLHNHYASPLKDRGIMMMKPGVKESSPGPSGPAVQLHLQFIDCKPDLCIFVYNIGQFCARLEICTIFKNSCNMYNMYNTNVNIVHKIACNIEQYGEQYNVQF